MKIGIITVEKSANFGSFLQAYALKVILERWGHEVYFLDAGINDELKKEYYNWFPRKRYLKHPLRFVRKNIYGKKKYKTFLVDHEKLTTIDAERYAKLDLTILGSDEVWNMSRTLFCKPLFYGGELNPVAAFAVSAGGAELKDFMKYPQFMKKIEQIEDVCVRDKNTLEIVEQIKHQSVPMVCDPTLLVDKCFLCERYTDEYLQQNKYILIYLYTGSIAKQSVEAIKIFAKKHGYKLVAAGLFNDWCDYNVICRPMEFVSVIQNAEYVITATFHGSIFSILNEKQFISISLTSKVKDLLENLGVSDRCVCKEEFSGEILEDKLLNACVDYDSVNKRIKMTRQYSLEQLKGILDKYERKDL